MQKPRGIPRGCTIFLMKAGGELLDVLASLLAVALASQRLFGALLFARFQIERMPFDLFDDVLLLDFALEAAQRAFQSFTILDMDFCQ
jgi:hypothetical protein